MSLTAYFELVLGFILIASLGIGVYGLRVRDEDIMWGAVLIAFVGLGVCGFAIWMAGGR